MSEPFGEETISIGGFAEKERTVEIAQNCGNTNRGNYSTTPTIYQKNIISKRHKRIYPPD